MTLAERIYWFQLDCGRNSGIRISQIAEGIERQEFRNAIADDLLKIIVEASKGIKEIGIADDGYEQMVYDDLVELHNRAVDLFNVLIEGRK